MSLEGRSDPGLRRGRGGRLAAVGALVLLAVLGPRAAEGAEIRTWYQTWGRIGTSAGVGFRHVTFDGARGGTDLASPIKLGTFHVRPLPNGSGFSYTDMPFQVSLDFYPGGTQYGRPIDSKPSEFLVEGILSGGVTADGDSDLTATVTSVRHEWTHGQALFEGAWVASSWLSNPGPILLGAGPGNRAELWISPKAGPGFPVPVPEPTGLVAWGAVGLGAVVVRSRHRRRASAIGG